MKSNCSPVGDWVCFEHLLKLKGALNSVTADEQIFFSNSDAQSGCFEQLGRINGKYPEVEG